MRRSVTTLFFLAALTAMAMAAPRSKEEFPPPAGFTSGFEPVDGVQLHYVRGGSGPLVLLVHGFGQTWYEWHQLMPLLARDHTVVAVDLPGLGLSEPPRTSYTGSDVSDYLYGLAKRVSPDRPFAVVAHDIGIWNSYPLVAKHPGDVSRVAFLEATVPDDTLFDLPAFTPKGEAPGWHHSFFFAGDHLADTLVKGHERLFLGHFLREHADKPAVFTDALVDVYAASYAKPGTFGHAFEYYRALLRSMDQNKEFARTKLAMPVLAIGGGGNGGFGAKQPTDIARYAGDLRSTVLPGCGHWLPEECADQLDPMLVSFLSVH